MKIIRIASLMLLCPLHLASAENPISGEWRQSLDGVWRFSTDAEAPEESWIDMDVPGNWDTTEEFSTYSGVGWYRRSFTPNEELQGKHVRLRFEAVYHESEVFLNGTRLGRHEGGYAPFEFDVTDKLLFDQPNQLVVSADNTFKRGAWWPWGGISRSVNLIANNPVRLVWQHIHADPDLDAGTADVSVRYRIHNASDTPAEVALRSRIESWDQELVAETYTLEANGTLTVNEQFTLPADQVRLWHFDHPEFYHLQTTLRAGGEDQHVVRDRFGIRKIEVKATEFLLNGEPVRLVGFNRISDDAGVFGNTEPDELVNPDVDLMKRAGANFSRIAHNPQAPNLLRRLDEKGMLLICEIPIWGDDPLAVPDNPLTKQWLKDMIYRDYNHPSIIGWSVSNEIRDYNGYPESMMNYIREELDPHRIVTYASFSSYRDGGEDEPVRETDLPMINMYRTFAHKFAVQVERWPDMPIYLSEFGMWQLEGGVDADFHEDFIPQWESFTRGQFPNLLGASLWTLNDYRSDRHGTPPTGFRSWGVVDEHRNLKPAYYTIRKLYSPLEVFEVEGSTVTVKTRPLGHIPSYTLRGYQIEWQKGTEVGVIDLPTLRPGDPAWTGDLPVSGATLKLLTPLGYDIDDTVNRFVFSDGVGTVLDDPGADFAGDWNHSTKIPGFIGSGYRFSGTPDEPNDGSATATFRFTAPAAGEYRLDMAYSPDPTRANNVPVSIASGEMIANFSVDQQAALTKGSYREIGTVTLTDGEETVITIGTTGTTGFVIVDALRFVRLE